MAARMFVLLVFSAVALFLQEDALRADENNRPGENKDPRVEEAEKRAVKSATEELFGKLKIGDAESILGLLTGSLLEERRELLEENVDYEQFLRDLYRNAYVIPKEGKSVGKGTRSIDVEIYFNDQEPPLQTRFILKQENGIWKIAEESTDDTDL
jgi:hypothetical protein